MSHTCFSLEYQYQLKVFYFKSRSSKMIYFTFFETFYSLINVFDLTLLEISKRVVGYLLSYIDQRIFLWTRSAGGRHAGEKCYAKVIDTSLCMACRLPLRHLSLIPCPSMLKVIESCVSSNNIRQAGLSEQDTKIWEESNTVPLTFINKN